MLINSPAPDFSLTDNRGQPHQLSVYRGRVVVVNFWSAECPWSERADRQLATVMDQFPDQVQILPVASNLNETSALIAQVIQQRGLEFVLIDHDCAVANAWGAQTTPHVFIVDQAGILRYQGASDDVTFRKRTPEHFYVLEIVTALLAGRLPDLAETQAYGCAIVRNV
jgi:peroxiredoxin